MIAKSLILVSASLALVAAAPTYLVPPKVTSVNTRDVTSGGSRAYNSHVHELLTGPPPAHVSKRLEKLAAGYKRDPGHGEDEDHEDCEDEEGGDAPPEEDDGECEADGETPSDPPSTPPSEGDDDCEDDEPSTPPPSGGDDEDCEDDENEGGGGGDDGEDCEDESSDSPSTPPTSSPPDNGSGSGSCSKQYTVQGGDYCSKVAETNNISLADFYKWNPQVDKDCMNLEIGQSYCVGM